MAPEDVAAGRKRKCPELSSLVTDHLHSRLTKAGIKVFRDDEELRAGEEIHPKLKNAIKQSTISITVFSKDYASRRSCLMEAVQMWECRKSNGQIIIPIFYNVRPHAVKNLEGDFATSFNKHDAYKKVDSETIDKWKEVLREVVELSGFDRATINGGHVTDLLDKVMTRVWQELRKDDQDVTDKLVGIDLHVQEMMTKLGVVYSHGKAMKVCGEDKRVVGICRMPGVGKTTLAKVVFNKIHKLIDACSFLKGINSEGVEFSLGLLIAELQKEIHEPLRFSGKVKKIKYLFSKTKVLIVLGDVREDEQIEALAGDLTWFGPGSRIIVTTDRRDVLKVFDFGEEEKDRAAEVYEVKPMSHHHALQLFRNCVFQGDASQDVSECDILSPDIVEALGRLPLAIKLQAEYLKKNKNRELWSSKLKSLKKRPLHKKVAAAFQVSYTSLDDTAKEIFLDIACFFIGKDKRIPPYMWEEAWDGDPLEGINQLRDMHFLEDGENNELRMHDLLREFGRELVKRKHLNQRCRFWNHSDALSFLNDGQSSYQGFKILGRNWRAPINLEMLIMEDCSRLSQIRQFISNLKKLRSLNLRNCSQVRKLPQELYCMKFLTELLIDGTGIQEIYCQEGSLKNLEKLSACNCKRLRDISTIGRLRKLSSLDLDGADIDGLPLAFEFPRTLERLSLRDCQKLIQLSTSIGKLDLLEVMDLSLTKITELPESVENLRRLKTLKMAHTFLPKFPEDIVNLKNLEEIDLSFCINLEWDIHCDISGLSSLRILRLSSSNVAGLPQRICHLSCIQTLDVRKCK
ncbi:hypothetical protein EUGRSUZ_C02627 [Eucalyptus grandis]|uniref:TIR domain-containing protein n=2 Tax=Eucalyptus grandis TaxID=71139 RepID=A0A059CSA4_EUCGR|nr:hypothetical protein EUGRSUZ_C02627 [Eucalyptus grandis]